MDKTSPVWKEFKIYEATETPNVLDETMSEEDRFKAFEMFRCAWRWKRLFEDRMLVNRVVGANADYLSVGPTVSFCLHFVVNSVIESEKGEIVCLGQKPVAYHGHQAHLEFYNTIKEAPNEIQVFVPQRGLYKVGDDVMMNMVVPEQNQKVPEWKPAQVIGSIADEEIAKMFGTIIREVNDKFKNKE